MLAKDVPWLFKIAKSEWHPPPQHRTRGVAIQKSVNIWSALLTEDDFKGFSHSAHPLVFGLSAEL